MKRSGPPARKTPMRRTGIARGASKLTADRGTAQAWQDRSRQTARSRPGRATGSTLAAVGVRGYRERGAAEAVRPDVWKQAAERAAEAHIGNGAEAFCEFPHDDPLMARVRCTAPRPDWFDELDGQWKRDARNFGRLEQCHRVPKGLATNEVRWHLDNLFVGCDAGNQWQETHTGEAIAAGVQLHMWDDPRKEHHR